MKLILQYGLLAGAAIFVFIMLELVLGLHGKYFLRAKIEQRF